MAYTCLKALQLQSTTVCKIRKQDVKIKKCF